MFQFSGINLILLLLISRNSCNLPFAFENPEYIHLNNFYTIHVCVNSESTQTNVGNFCCILVRMELAFAQTKCCLPSNQETNLKMTDILPMMKTWNYRLIK